MSSSLIFGLTCGGIVQFGLSCWAGGVAVSSNRDSDAAITVARICKLTLHYLTSSAYIFRDSHRQSPRSYLPLQQLMPVCRPATPFLSLHADYH